MRRKLIENLFANFCKSLEINKRFFSVTTSASPQVHRPRVMTFREAAIEAWMELGMSRETAELSAKFSDAFVPDAAAVAQSTVKPGYEQQLIAELKMIYRKMDADPGAVKAAVRTEMEKRAKKN